MILSKLPIWFQCEWVMKRYFLKEHVGYNSGMKNIEEKVIANFEIIKNNVYDKFGTVW